MRTAWTNPPTWSSVGLSYLLLAVSTVLAITVGQHPPGDLTLILALVGTTAVWLPALWWITPRGRRRPTPPVLLYFAGLLALLIVLSAHDQYFSIFGGAVYNQAFLLFSGRSMFLAFTAVALGQAGAGLSGGKPSVYTLGLGLVLPMLLAGWFVGWESDRRQKAITELAETNAKLEAVLRENVGLHAQLVVQARAAGAQDERQRMAGEIHDTLAQGLTGIITQLEAAERGEGCPDRMRAHVGKACALARQSLTEARRSVHALRPEQLERSRLPEAIAAMAEQWSQRQQVPVTVHTTGEQVPLGTDVEVTLFRVAQEALANVAKHANASRVGLTLSYMDDVVLMDVRDDGVGFSVETITGCERGDGGGFGLEVMRQRLRRVAGTLGIESMPGEGTTVNATVPAVPAAGNEERE